MIEQVTKEVVPISNDGFGIFVLNIRGEMGRGHTGLKELNEFDQPADHNVSFQFGQV